MDVKGWIARLGQATGVEAELQKIELAGKLAHEGGEDDCVKLAWALRRTKAGPTHLDLSCNQLGDKAAAKLAKTIEQSGSTIERVLLHDNTFSGKGMDKLLQALGTNLRITELTIERQGAAEEKDEKRIGRHIKRVLASTAEFHKAISGKTATVNLLGRGLSQVPASFLSQLTHLTVLNLNHNRIRDLPEEMSQLTKLEELRLSENQIEVLPGWVARMVALKIIDLRYNERLVTLPLGLAQLPRLECLEFGANKQDKLKRLQVLRESRYATVAQQTEEAERDADHQVLIPQEIVFHGGKEIISWLREMAKGEKIEHRFKVMVVGSPGVGKTLLSEWLFQKTKMENRNIDAYVPTPTHGVTRTWAEVPNKRHKFNHTPIACCYDCGGDDIGPEFMLTGRTVYVVVFNVMQPEEEHSRLEHWLKRISNGVESPVPVLAVATHADDRNLTAAHKKKVGLLIDKLRETYPAQLRELFLVNARQGKGVDDVRNKLVDVAVDHFWLAQPVPNGAGGARTYVALSTALIDLNVPSVEDRVIANCDLGGATPDPENVTPALGFLADLGLVVYNKPLVTLEPLWVSEALGEATVSIETKIAREVPLTRPRGDQETAVQLLDLGVEVRRLEKEFALIQALLENKTYWPKEDLGTQTNNKRRSVVPKLKLAS
ncbi:leucine rich repeat domain containing protein [Acanthamoeba castellanii str. Neff]|uniref:Leucine rich repeat domain containing protein n=1 Tax=Acanthamoeba castellanii (strain ATCC 30010 / Neff) TaxID=1257118 RepID=L8H7A0_ACACF|nr:leucine rich repeat domain containing protein [Acanthamoeba castellanii str. Neff]ELR21020.1 leucine rich repeat domain containing protein [Acanthamoeba castellanii str. Neff]